MSRVLPALRFITQFVVLGLALAFLLTLVFPERFGVPPVQQAAPRSEAAPSSYAEAVRRAGPWVVSISAESLVASSAPAPVFGDPTWRRFSESSSPVQQLMRSLGSGVIMSNDGYVLTNLHVVKDAQLIRIGLWDERVTSAKLVGSDPATDLAVLKIEGSDFPAAQFADESKLAVGDVVLAIGNPYGYDRTVTMGVISATRRNTGRRRFENFLQTDAAVNSGNSGGALINTQGELVGINSINLGEGLSIGLAIPAASARDVLQQIVKFGEVIRGWMGAEYFDAPFSPAGGNTAVQRGAQIARLLNGGPAANAGLRTGDIVMEFDGQPVIDGADLRLREAALAPGSKVAIGAMRAGIPLSVEIELMRQPGAAASR